jgi:hypothetical protein
MITISAAKHLGGYRIWLCFSDGEEGTVDLGLELDGPVFEPLRDPAVFARFTVHPELKTLVWPNGADLAPEFLYDMAMAQPLAS